MKNELYPGQLIEEEIITRDWTIKDFADITGLSISVTKKIIKGKTKISVDIAERLGKAFGNSSQFWINLQNSSTN